MNLPSPIKMLLICVVFLTKIATVGYAQNIYDGNITIGGTTETITIENPTTVAAKDTCWIDLTSTTPPTNQTTPGPIELTINNIDNSWTGLQVQWVFFSFDNLPNKGTKTSIMDSGGDLLGYEEKYSTVDNAVTDYPTIKTENKLSNTAKFTLPNSYSDPTKIPAYAIRLAHDGCFSDFVSQWMHLGLKMSFCPDDITSATYDIATKELSLTPDSWKFNNERTKELSKLITATLFGNSNERDNYFDDLKQKLEIKEVGGGETLTPTSGDYYLKLGQTYNIHYALPGTTNVLLTLQITIKERPKINASASLVTP